MYHCREKGFELYNGGENDKKDNVSGREYLLSNEGVVEWEKLKDSIKNKDDIDNKYEEIMKKFDDWLKDRGYDTVVSEKNDEEIEEIWSKRVERLKTSEDEDYLLITSSGKIKGKKTLNSDDMDDCHIDGIGINDLLETYNTDYAIWSTFGMYVVQGPITILRTKMHDIEKLKLVRPNGYDSRSFSIEAKAEGDGTEGICVWSLKNYGIEYKRNKLISKDNDGDALYGKRLLFLPYTSSNKAVDWSAISLDMEIYDGEDIDDYHKRLKQ